MTRKEFLISVGTLIVAMVPIVAVLKKLGDSSATSPSTSGEAENGTRSIDAALVASSSASGGQAVTFGTTPPAAKTNAILVFGGGAMTDAEFAQLAAWGIDGIVFGCNLAGINYVFNSTNPQQLFSGSPTNVANDSYQTQRNYTTTAQSAHKYNIKVYAGFCPFNSFQASSTTRNFSAGLGSWRGVASTSNNGYSGFTDPRGYTWPDWYQVCADFGDALHLMGFDGIYSDNEDVKDNLTNVFSSWNAGYPDNGFGATTTIAQEQAWAKTAGANMMAAFNNGRTDLHPAYGNNYAIVSYNSTSIGRLGNMPGCCFGAFNKYFGNTITITYDGVTHTNMNTDTAMATYSTYPWWMAGMASATKGSVLWGDPFFYNYEDITHSGLPWTPSGTTDAQAWVGAIAYDVAGFAKLANGTTIPGLTLPSNCYISPMIWPLSQGLSAGNGPTWSQTAWNNAKAAIWAGSQNGQYMLYQQPVGYTYGSGLAMNYADNMWVNPPGSTGTLTGGNGANYTPLNG